MLVGIVINVAILLCMFWNQISPPKDGKEQGKELEAAVTEEEVTSHTFSPVRMSHPSPLHPQLSPLNPQRTPANDVEKNMSQSNGMKRGCAPVFGMKSCLTKNELFLKGFV
ncbi:transporter arsB [Canna indica]|uniref:Transporter arsB n=1 Tax=Canna indica TaxID=4628 RepID=A0AAQ3KVJ4_9LILI|nr:transporter arsB [Canna indica]